MKNETEPELAVVRKRRDIGDMIRGVFIYSVLFLILIVILFPILIVAFNSFKTEEDFYKTGPFGLPTSVTLISFQKAMETIQFFPRLINSILISLPVAIIAAGLSLLNGYAIGIGKIKGRIFFLIFFLIAMTIPQESLIYPLYYLFRIFKLYNTHLGVILCLAALNLAFGTYLMGTVLNDFPKDFIESARIDGAGSIYILRKVVVPLAMPTLSVLFVMFFIWTWNDFFISLVMLVSEKIQTIPLGILRTRGQYRVAMTDQGAAALLLCLPSIIFFLIFQRTLTRGITAAGLKG
jgi:raffinose/stachyose/melibiose transport system permease protein